MVHLCFSDQRPLRLFKVPSRQLHNSHGDYKPFICQKPQKTNWVYYGGLSPYLYGYLFTFGSWWLM